MDADRLDYLLAVLKEEMGIEGEKAIRAEFNRLRFDTGVFTTEYKEDERECAG